MALNLYDNFPATISDNSTNATNDNTNTQQRFKYLVVLDFEATCAKNRKINPQEIIEWPAIIIETETNKILSNKNKIFHYYIKPKYNPKLTPFCTQLTGITQDIMDNIAYKNTVESVTHQWNKWCFDNNLLPTSKDKPNACIVTCGDWDLKTCWKQQKEISNCTVAALFHSWINIKIIFKRNAHNNYHSNLSMMSMLKYLNISHRGRHHSGIDDVRNICKIVQKLLKNGAVFDYTSKQFGKTNVCTDINIKTNFINFSKQDNDGNTKGNSNNSSTAKMDWSPQSRSPSPPPEKYFHKGTNKINYDNNEQKIQ